MFKKQTVIFVVNFKTKKMIRLFSFIMKLLVIFTVGNTIVLLLSFVAFLMWNKKYMELSRDFVEKINSELKF